VLALKKSHTLFQIEDLRPEPSLRTTFVRYEMEKNSDVMETVLTRWKLLGTIIIKVTCE